MPDNQQTQQFLIPNTTQVPDVLIDHLMAELSGAEFKVMMYITRRTYGFKKHSDYISLTQLLSGITKEEGEVLDRGTGLSRSTLVAALKSLQDKELIVAEKRSSAEKGFETTLYSLNFNAPLLQTLVRKPNSPPSFENRTRLVRKSNPQHPVRQHPERTLSSIRKAQPKNEEKNEEGKGKQPLLPGSLTVSVNDPQRLPQPEKSGKETREGETSPAKLESEVSSPVSSPGLTRQYLQQAQAQRTRQTNSQGLVSLSSLLPHSQQSLPKPTPKKRTYSQERQVLVDLLADLAREFRDEATLTESVSRAYNLMGKAGITDIGVFTAKIYEARAITKERYGSIKWGRMPYFFSVLADVCGQRPKSEVKPDHFG
jgi:Bacteriophage replication protein O